MSQRRIKRRVMVVQGDGRLAPPDERHNYMRRLLAHAEAGLLAATGAVELTIRHDPWCGVFSGGRCNCDPQIVRRRAGVN